MDLKTADGWDRGWTVNKVFNTEDEDVIVVKSRDYRKQRKASDI